MRHHIPIDGTRNSSSPIHVIPKGFIPFKVIPTSSSVRPYPERLHPYRRHPEARVFTSGARACPECLWACGPSKEMKNRGGLLRCRRRGTVKALFALDQLRPSLSLTWNVRL